jgi:uncharacterized protein YbdZ (MbtH family)
MAVSRATLHHLPQKSRSLEEMYRVLQPGGISLVHDMRRDVKPELLAKFTRMGDVVMKDVLYRVVRNDEGQYSVWPADDVLPNGWLSEGKEGTKADCLSHIKEVWNDLRPLSLQQAK